MHVYMCACTLMNTHIHVTVWKMDLEGVLSMIKKRLPLDVGELDRGQRKSIHSHTT